MEFKDRLRAAIRDQNLTQAQAAEKIGCNPHMLGYYLRGSEPRRPMYERILEAFPSMREEVAG